MSNTTNCKHEWTDDGQWLQVCTLCGRQEDHDPKWRDMDTAPRDGTLLRLLVEFDEHSTEDSDHAPTIGANNFDHDGLDEWKFAGWCWTHDHFTEGKGTPIGWLPLMNDPVVITPYSPAEHLHGNYGALKNHCIAAIKASGIPVDDCSFDGPDLFALMIDLTKKIDELRLQCGGMQMELEECVAMAEMIEEHEWAEHVGTGTVSKRVEVAFTQLHNDINEEREKRTNLAKRVMGYFGDPSWKNPEGCTLWNMLRKAEAGQ